MRWESGWVGGCKWNVRGEEVEVMGSEGMKEWEDREIRCRRGEV